MAEALRIDADQLDAQTPQAPDVRVEGHGGDEENMRNVKLLLAERMDPDFGLLDKLLQLRALTFPERGRIKSEKSIFDRNDKLLEIIFKSMKHHAMLTALEETGQKHLSNVMRANGEYKPEYGAVWPLQEREIQILDEHRHDLVEFIDPCDLITRMFSKGAVNHRQQRYINNLHDDTDKSEALLDILRRGSVENYRKTVFCLRESNQSRVAEILEDGGVLATVHVSNGGEAEQVDEDENNIIEAMVNLLQNKTLPQYQRIRERLDLRIILARKGQSIVFYIYCKTLEEVLYLLDLLTSGEFKKRIAEVFDLLISKRETTVSEVSWSEEEFTRFKTHFENADRLIAYPNLGDSLKNKIFYPPPTRIAHKTVQEMASADWHHSKDLLLAVQSFHEKYVHQPQKQMTEAKAHHTALMGEIEKQMKPLGILVRLEYTGSAYDGTKVAKTPDNYDLTFRVMLIIDSRGKGLQVEKMPTKAGFVKLKIQGQGAAAPPGSNTLFGHFEGNYLNAQRTADEFFSELQKCINNSQKLSAAVTLRRNGPAAQVDVSRGGALFYSVDVVPTYEVNGERYVAKPITGDAMPDSLAWRRSYSIEAKEKILGADGNNGCRKKVFRILKVIRNREPVLAPLTSYHLKTALFLEMDNPGLIWSEDELGKRLMGVLYQLEIRLTEGNLPHYFLGSAVNLLSLVTKITIENMRDRVRRFRSNEIEMKRILSV